MAADAPLKNNQTKSGRGGKRPGAGRKPGSPNKSTAALRAIAQQYTEQAIAALVGVMEDGESDAAKVSAANALLDRGYGKAPQTIGDGEGNAVDLISLIVAARERAS